MNRAGRDDVVVVENEVDVDRYLAHPPYDLGNDMFLREGLPCPKVALDERGERFAGRGKTCEEVAKEEVAVIVCLVEGIPRDSHFIAVDPLAGEGGLARSGNSGDDDEPRAFSGGQAVEKMGAFDHPGGEGGHLELRADDLVHRLRVECPSSKGRSSSFHPRVLNISKKMARAFLRTH